MSDNVAPLPRAVKFQSKNFKAELSGNRYHIWWHDLAEGETFDDCLDPNAYVNVMAANTIPNPGDTVQVRTFDKFSRVDFLVIASSKTWLKLRKFQECIGADVVVPAESPLATKWNVGKLCYEIIRKSDKAVLRTDFKTKADAVDWASEHVKQMAA